MRRNLRANSLKVKHVLQMFVLVAICVWFLHSFKHSQYMKSELVSEKERVKIGRKQLKPRVDEVERGGGEEVELMENGGSRAGERDGEEMDEWEKEKSEEVQVEVEVEHDQMQDFIDEDDKDQLLVEA